MSNPQIEFQKSNFKTSITSLSCTALLEFIVNVLSQLFLKIFFHLQQNTETQLNILPSRPKHNLKHKLKHNWVKPKLQ